MTETELVSLKLIIHVLLNYIYTYILLAEIT
jgi:hypothetical protein